MDTIDQALLDDMAASGCIEIKFGMESGGEVLLKAMRKNTKQHQIRNAVRMARQAGIKVKLFLHGTDRDPGWDGDWSRYHIHHNHLHWWGSDQDFSLVQRGYEELRGRVDRLWPERFADPVAVVS